MYGRVVTKWVSKNLRGDVAKTTRMEEGLPKAGVFQIVSRGWYGDGVRNFVGRCFFTGWLEP